MTAPPTIEAVELEKVYGDDTRALGGITFAADLTVLSMSAALCAVETKPASNCAGAR